MPLAHTHSTTGVPGCFRARNSPWGHLPAPGAGKRLPGPAWSHRIPGDGHNSVQVWKHHVKRQHGWQWHRQAGVAPHPGRARALPRFPPAQSTPGRGRRRSELLLASLMVFHIKIHPAVQPQHLLVLVSLGKELPQDAWSKDREELGFKTSQYLLSPSPAPSPGDVSPTSSSSACPSWLRLPGARRPFAAAPAPAAGCGP